MLLDRAQLVILMRIQSLGGPHLLEYPMSRHFVLFNFYYKGINIPVRSFFGFFAVSRTRKTKTTNLTEILQTRGLMSRAKTTTIFGLFIVRIIIIIFCIRKNDNLCKTLFFNKIILIKYRRKKYVFTSTFG